MYHTIVIAHPALATRPAELKQERLEVAKELTACKVAEVEAAKEQLGASKADLEERQRALIEAQQKVESRTMEDEDSTLGGNIPEESFKQSFKQGSSSFEAFEEKKKKEIQLLASNFTLALIAISSGLVSMALRRDWSSVTTTMVLEASARRNSRHASPPRGSARV